MYTWLISILFFVSFLVITLGDFRDSGDCLSLRFFMEDFFVSWVFDLSLSLVIFNFLEEWSSEANDFLIEFDEKPLTISAFQFSGKPSSKDCTKSPKPMDKIKWRIRTKHYHFDLRTENQKCLQAYIFFLMLFQQDNY